MIALAWLLSLVVVSFVVWIVFVCAAAELLRLAARGDRFAERLVAVAGVEVLELDGELERFRAAGRAAAEEDERLARTCARCERVFPTLAEAEAHWRENRDRGFPCAAGVAP